MHDEVTGLFIATLPASYVHKYVTWSDQLTTWLWNHAHIHVGKLTLWTHLWGTKDGRGARSTDRLAQEVDSSPLLHFYAHAHDDSCRPGSRSERWDGRTPFLQSCTQASSVLPQESTLLLARDDTHEEHMVRTREVLWDFDSRQLLYLYQVSVHST